MKRGEGQRDETKEETVLDRREGEERIEGNGERDIAQRARERTRMRDDEGRGIVSEAVPRDPRHSRSLFHGFAEERRLPCPWHEGKVNLVAYVCEVLTHAYFYHARYKSETIYRYRKNKISQKERERKSLFFNL